MNTAAPPHPQWLIPDWPAPARVRALVTTRAGGVSMGPYASMNLGTRTADDPAAVAENRARLQRCLPQPPQWLAQVHGTTAVDADKLTGSPTVVPQADASVARCPGTVCAILIADCLPILLTDRAGGCVGAAHAGWRGLAGGVIANTVARMPAAPADLMAWIGPGIGPTAFEVGDDVRQAFGGHAPEHSRAFTPLHPGKWLCDLPLLARDALRRAGVAQIYGGDLCTWSDAQRFYSYRRDKVTGRMAALIWRTSAE
ncbi:MAG: peptidoglycan editing factor PgeF [Burkholderiales bacterium]|nr:peptidoglycan editing factor PgeF [Burkholderiales bacterium]